MTPAAIFAMCCLAVGAFLYFGLGLAGPGAVLAVVAGWWFASWLESEER